MAAAVVVVNPLPTAARLGRLEASPQLSERSIMANLTELTESHMAASREEERGRSAELVAHDGPLRQTVIALREGVRMAEHNSPPAASLQVLKGRVRVDLDDEAQGEFGEGELWILTHERHSVMALEDSAFLLTTVTSQQGQSSYS